MPQISIRKKLERDGYVQIGSYDEPATAQIGDKVFLHDIGENEDLYTVKEVKRKAWCESDKKPGYGFKVDKVFNGRQPGPYAFSDVILYRKQN